MPESKILKLLSPRRRWPIAEKRRIVELTFREGASIGAIAREHGLHPTSLCQWKALYRSGKLDAHLPQSRTRASSASFLPVTIAPAPDVPQRGLVMPSIMQVTFPSGATLRIEAGLLDAEFVCTMIVQLQR